MMTPEYIREVGVLLGTYDGPAGTPIEHYQLQVADAWRRAVILRTENGTVETAYLEQRA